MSDSNDPDAGVLRNQDDAYIVSCDLYPRVKIVIHGEFPGSDDSRQSAMCELDRFIDDVKSGRVVFRL